MMEASKIQAAIESLMEGAEEPYTPAHPEHWRDPQPESTAEAIARIAAFLASKQGAPIP
jgi:hypothetical protein